MTRQGCNPILVLPFLFVLSGCVSLVAPYDAQFDQDLNKLSADTARFLAASSARGPERSISSKETVTYYANSYNVLDRLSQRASLKRGSIACKGNDQLKEFSEQPTSSSALPDDYAEFDCLEAQLYYVRFYLDQLQYAQKNDGVLNAGEAKAVGGFLQTSISGAIQTFLVTKP